MIFNVFIFIILSLTVLLSFSKFTVIFYLLISICSLVVLVILLSFFSRLVSYLICRRFYYMFLFLEIVLDLFVFICYFLELNNLIILVILFIRLGSLFFILLSGIMFLFYFRFYFKFDVTIYNLICSDSQIETTNITDDYFYGTLWLKRRRFICIICDSNFERIIREVINDKVYFKGRTVTPRIKVSKGFKTLLESWLKTRVRDDRCFRCIILNFIHDLGPTPSGDRMLLLEYGPAFTQHSLFDTLGSGVKIVLFGHSGNKDPNDKESIFIKGGIYLFDVNSYDIMKSEVGRLRFRKIYGYINLISKNDGSSNNVEFIVYQKGRGSRIY